MKYRFCIFYIFGEKSPSFCDNFDVIFDAVFICMKILAQQRLGMPDWGAKSRQISNTPFKMTESK
jgi:hypothetical protein